MYYLTLTTKFYLLGGRVRLQDAFFLEGADGLGTKLHGNFFAVQHEGFVLEVRLPDFFGMALRKTDAVAVLFAFAV